MVSMAPIKVTKTKAGNSAQKVGPKLKSKPGQPPSGTPNQSASATRPKSYSPNAEATALPTSKPITGTQSRTEPLAFSERKTITTSVDNVLTGAAMGAVPSGTSFNISNTTGITVTAISMMTTPATVGVMSFRNQASRAASANWNMAAINTSVASMAGPPSAIAATQTAMNAADVPMSNG